MDSKKMFSGILFFAFLLEFTGFRECEDDVFGNRMELIVPINTYPSQDTFYLGDTLWVAANIDKHVEVAGQDERIFLEGFNFFTELGISEISDTVENFISEVEIIEKVGQVEALALATTLVYPVFYEESDISYNFGAGLVLNQS